MLDNILRFFNYNYSYLNQLKNVLDNFSFGNSFFSDFFGAIRYILGDPIYLCFYTLIIATMGFLLYKLFRAVFHLQ